MLLGIKLTGRDVEEESDLTDQIGREIFCKCHAYLIVSLYMLKSSMKFVYRHIQGPHIFKVQAVCP